MFRIVDTRLYIDDKDMENFYDSKPSNSDATEEYNICNSNTRGYDEYNGCQLRDCATEKIVCGRRRKYCQRKYCYHLRNY